MFKVTRFTADPTTADAQEVTSAEFDGLKLAKGVAATGSRVDGGYYAVYAEDGEQLAGFVDGEEVY